MKGRLHAAALLAAVVLFISGGLTAKLTGANEWCPIFCWSLFSTIPPVPKHDVSVLVATEGGAATDIFLGESRWPYVELYFMAQPLFGKRDAELVRRLAQLFPDAKSVEMIRRRYDQHEMLKSKTYEIVERWPLELR